MREREERKRESIIYMHLYTETEEDDAHFYIKRPSKNILQEKCYKNNHDELRYRDLDNYAT